MNPHLALSTSTAAVISASGLTTAAVSGHGTLAEKTRPFIGVMTEDESSPHPKMHRGTLVIIHEYDAAASLLPVIADESHLVSTSLCTGALRAALKAALAESGLWLRILGPETSTQTVDLEPGIKAHETRIPYWIQSAF